MIAPYARLIVPTIIAVHCLFYQHKRVLMRMLFYEYNKFIFKHFIWLILIYSELFYLIPILDVLLHLIIHCINLMIYRTLLQVPLILTLICEMLYIFL